MLGLTTMAVAADAVSPPPPKTLQEVDQRLAAMFAAQHIPGGAVALIENGKVTFIKAYGVADTAKNTPATVDTPFRAGSISKSFTSIAVMTLVEQGKLSLDDKLADLVPEVKFNNSWESTNPLRLVHLLEHTTGWPDISLHMLDLNHKDWSTLRGVQEASPDFVSRWRPGQFSVYNNAGPAVAGYIIEKKTGKTYFDYMRESVLRPMGMATADFDLPPDLAKRISKSYAPDGSEVPYQYIVLAPAGSLNTSVRELTQLVRFYIGRGTIDGHQILKPQSVARIEQSLSNMGVKYGFTNGYGLGNAAFTDKGITFRGHNGNIDAFSAVAGYTLRNNSGYVMMANGGTEGVNFGTDTSQMLQNYLTRGLPLNPKPTVTVSDDELQRYAGLYRVITPPNRLLQPFVDLLNMTWVSAEHGKLVISGNDWFPASPHTFRRTDREDYSLAFFNESDDTIKLGAFNAQQRISPWQIAVIGVVGVLIALGVIISIVMVPVWLISWARGRLKDRGGMLVRALPSLALATMLLTFVLPLLAVASSTTSSIHSLSQVGPYSVTILICSILFPLFAAAGFVISFLRPRAHFFARAYAGLTTLAVLAFAGYAADIGWFAVRTWTM